MLLQVSRSIRVASLSAKCGYYYLERSVEGLGRCIFFDVEPINRSLSVKHMFELLCFVGRVMNHFAWQEFVFLRMSAQILMSWFNGQLICWFVSQHEVLFDLFDLSTFRAALYGFIEIRSH